MTTSPLCKAWADVEDSSDETPGDAANTSSGDSYTRPRIDHRAARDGIDVLHDDDNMMLRVADEREFISDPEDSAEWMFSPMGGVSTGTSSNSQQQQQQRRHQRQHQSFGHINIPSSTSSSSSNFSASCRVLRHSRERASSSDNHLTDLSNSSCPSVASEYPSSELQERAAEVEWPSPPCIEQDDGEIPLDKHGQPTSVGSALHASGRCTPCLFHHRVAGCQWHNM